MSFIRLTLSRRLFCLFPSEQHYLRVANESLENLTDQFDTLPEKCPSLPKDYDVQFSNGVLTVRLGGDKGIYVLNTQTPNQQIWLSSPVSGPVRCDFKFDSNTWMCRRLDVPLHTLLSSELSQCFSHPIEIESPAEDID